METVELLKYIMMRNRILFIFTFIGIAFCTSVKSQQGPNILFIAVDDLAPRLGCMGDRFAITPNLDQLATDGVLFKRAFCQAAACFPSRVSTLTGYRPESINMTGTFSKHVPSGTVPLPRLFKQNGYTTVMAGKVWHNSNDDLGGWTRVRDDFGVRGGYCAGYQLDKNKETVKNYLQARELPTDVPRSETYEMIDYPDSLSPDGIIANIGIDELQKLNKDEKPFFLALGFYRPHLPYTTPKKYWDMHDKKTFPPIFSEPVKNGLQKWESNEVRRYGDIPDTGSLIPGSPDFPIEKALQLTQGYYASVTFVDVQIGKVLEELKRLKLDKNTIVLLWSDNGFSLGSHSFWGKYTNHRISTQITLIASVPGKKSSGSCEEFVELVDIYPTLCDLTGIKKPDWLEGTSFVPLIDKPDRKWKEAVFTTAHGRRPAIRTHDYLFVVHPEKEKTAGGSHYELFDLKKDPNETINVIDNPGYKNITKEMLERYESGWKAAFPGSI